MEPRKERQEAYEIPPTQLVDRSYPAYTRTRSVVFRNPTNAVGDVMKQRLPRRASLIRSRTRAGQLTAVGRRL